MEVPTTTSPFHNSDSDSHKRAIFFQKILPFLCNAKLINMIFFLCIFQHVIVEKCIRPEFCKHIGMSVKRTKTDSAFRECSYLIGNLSTKEPSSTPWADSPGVYILWIGPDKITKCSLVRDFLIAFNGAYLVKSFDVR